MSLVNVFENNKKKYRTLTWNDIVSGIPTEFKPAAHTQAWSTITEKPTTLAEYGITDAAPAGYGLGLDGANKANNTDFNTLDGNGFFNIYSDGTAPNAPSTDPGYWLVNTMRRSAGAKTQTATNVSTNKKYERNYSGTTWSAWRQLAFTDNPVFNGLISTSGTGYGSLTSAQIDLVNTTPVTGKTWSINALNDGGFQIYNKTSGLTALMIKENRNAMLYGNVGLGDTTNPLYKLDMLITENVASNFLRLGAISSITNGFVGLSDASNNVTFAVSSGSRFAVGHDAPKATLHSTGSTILGLPSTAPNDADIGNGQMYPYLDGDTIKIRIKKSDGTLITKTIA